MKELKAKKCVSCEGNVQPLGDMDIDKFLKSLDGWKLKIKTDTGSPVNTIAKSITFKDFRHSMAFLRCIEEIAESEGHHPNFCVHYNKIDFSIWTHAIDGLHENDFILAAKIDDAFEKSSKS